MKKILILALALNLSTSVLARPFFHVVQAMLVIIPESEEALRIDLNRLITINEIINKNITSYSPNSSDAKLAKYLNHMLLIAPEQRTQQLWVYGALCLRKHFSSPENLNSWQTQASGVFMDDLDYRIFLDNREGI